MNECHECGSEIVEFDAFCPFCGISLPVGSSEDGEKDSDVEPVDTEVSEDAKSSEDQIEVSSGGEDEAPEDDMDMSETIVIPFVKSSEDKEKQESDDASDEFVDVSSLKDELKVSEKEEKGPESDSLESDLDLEQEPNDPTNVADVKVSGEDGWSDISAVKDEVEEQVVSDVEDDKELEVGGDALETEGSSNHKFSGAPGRESEIEAEEKEADDVPETDSSTSEESVDSVVDEAMSDSPTLIENTEEKTHEDANAGTEESDDSDMLEDATMMMPFPEDNKEKGEDGDSDGSLDETSAENPETAESEDSKVDAAIASPQKSDSDINEPKDDPKAEGVGVFEPTDSNVQDFSETVSYDRSDLKDLKQINKIEKDEVAAGLSEEKEPEDDFGVGEKESTSSGAVSNAEEEDTVTKAAEELDSLKKEDALLDGSNPDSDASAELDSEPRSQTTPNIGAEDTDGSNKTKLKPISEGTILNGRYEVVRKIGGGGMGAVYLANDKNLGGVLRAVKEMVQSYIEEEQQEKAINDFKRESMLLTSLEHPCIPTIYDYFFDETEGRFYLVMKYISGGDLSGKLRAAPEGRLDEKSVVEWGIQVADVLDYLHNRQPPIVYRDLKPANVMIDGNSGRVMLIDFGIARWVNKEEKGVTAVGTMGYAPPELFSGNVEPRSDIYSLGSTMFHLLTGADPQSNPLLIFDFQKNPRPRQINSAISDQIEQILMRSVEYSADSRFATAAEMRDVLAAHMENLQAGNVSYGVKESPEAIGLADQPVFCGFCGQKIVATDMFCAFCGAKQPLAQPGIHSQEYSSVQLTAKLIIEGTSDLEVPAFLLEKDDNLIGRRDPMSNIFPEVDLSKFDPQTKISRKHARIWRDGDNFMLEDLNSSNGTVLMTTVGDPVRLAPKQARALTNGDTVRLGDTTLQFIVD